VFFSLFAVACLIAAELAQLATGVVTRWPLPLISPQVGIMTAALLLMRGRDRAAAVLIASIISAVVMIAGYGLPAAPSVALCVIAALEACAAAALLRLLLHPRAAFRRVEDMWMLALVASGVPLAGAVLAAVVLSTTAGEPSMRSAAIEWWLAEMTGLIVVVPIAYGISASKNGVLGILRSWRGFEGLFVFAATCVITYLLFSETVPKELRLPIYLLPFLLWACLRLDLAGTSLVVFGASIIGITYTTRGMGPFVLELSPVSASVLRAQGGVAMASMFFPMLALIVAERKRVLAERDQLVSELQQALMEVKTLQGMIPICAWCHKIRDDEGFWQGVDTYLQDKIDATFSHAICPTCSAQQHERYGLSMRKVETTRTR
jgi:integral membrane sensor domain MASE1